MKLRQTLALLLVTVGLSAGLMFAADAAPAPAKEHPPGKQANCCIKAEKAGKTCEHECCIEAAKAGKNCEKCKGTNEAPAPTAKK
jgi:hypothetical protein